MARAESEESMSRMENLRPRLTNDINVMLVGPAGAGKSSLIKSLIQLCKSSDGSLPCDYSYIPPVGGDMLGGHTLMRQTVDSSNTLTFTNNSGWHDWSNETAVKGLTAQIRGEKAINEIDRTDTESDSTPLKHAMVPHLAFSEVDCIAVVLNGQAGIEGFENFHGLVEACRKNTGRRPFFVITHKDTMSGEQIELMKTALQTEYALDPYTIFFIENITTLNEEMVDVEWQSRLCEFLAVCADVHRMKENTMLQKLEECNKARWSKQREWKNRCHQLHISEPPQKLKPYPTTCDSLVDTQARLQSLLLKDEREIRNYPEMALKENYNIVQKKYNIVEEKYNLVNEKYNIMLQTNTVCKRRKFAFDNELNTKRDRFRMLEESIKKMQNTTQQKHEQMKIDNEKERSDLSQKIETAAKLTQQKERETMKKKKKKSLPKKHPDVIASVRMPKAGLPDTCSNRENLDHTDVRKLEEEQPNEEFAAILKHIADGLHDETNIDTLGGQLGIMQGDTKRALVTNVTYNRVTSDGTHFMLNEWRREVYREDERVELGNALVAAELKDLDDHYFPQDELVRATSMVKVHEEQTDPQITEEEEHEDEEEKEEEEGYTAMKSLPNETDEVDVTPFKTECCKRVGDEGGKLQLDSFGIELEIPPGAIDSEAPHDIYLSVLTGTPNLGNSKAEMSVCFGVQCLAPADLVLKLPVTYTIPHCAVITQYSSVEAVLYTGEGEYSPDAVVKERSVLSRSGIPSCTITKDVLKLKMNHFSWMMIKLFFRDFFFPGKKMCCRPFKENNLTLQKTPVILHAHLYDDIKGNSEMVESKERKHEFVPAHMELQVLIQAAEGGLKMTCSVNETVIGRHVDVSCVKLMSGTRICEPFELVFPNQSDSVAVSLKVGQQEKLEVNLLFRLEDSTERASPQDQEEMEGASSSKTPQTSHQSTVETPDSGRQEDFDDKLNNVAQKVSRWDEINSLGRALGSGPEDIQRYVDTNMKTPGVSYMGTLLMLQDWRKKQTEATECEALNGVLRKAGQIHLAYKLFGNSFEANDMPLH